MRSIDTIVVHCSDTHPGMDIGVDEIRKWHTEERQWTDIGYHFVIRRDGTIEDGRPVERPGAHAKGYNSNSIGICWVGGASKEGGSEDNRTAEQSIALFHKIRNIQEKFPGAALVGHRDLKGVNKACPCFDVRTWYSEACMNTEKKAQEKERGLQEKTDRPSMTFRFLLWTTLKLWRLYRFIRRR